MINKIGKVFKSSKNLATPKSIKNNISNGKLKATLDSPTGMRKIASNLNKIDDAVIRANTTTTQKIGSQLQNSGAKLAYRGETIIEKNDLKTLYHVVGAAHNKSGNYIKNQGQRIAKHDKLVDFNLKGAIAKDLKLHANQAMNFAGSMFEATDKNLLGVKLSTKGKVVAGGLAMASGTKQATGAFNENTMGTQRDSRITPHAPRIPAYANNGGATGDLVFALNANRNG